MQIGSLIKQIDTSNNGLHEINDEELQELHKVLTTMMRDIASFCEKNDISWCLSGGSILGAVRHGGFIPWDDDIDIFMTRKNFEKLYRIFPKENCEYEIRRPGDKGYLLHYPQIIKKNTIAQSIQSSTEPENLFIDVFILENAPNNWLLRKMHGFICSALLFIYSTVRMKKCEKNLLKYGSSSPALIKAVKQRVFFSRFFSFFPLEKWLYISDRVFALIKDETTEYLVAPGGAKHYFGEIFERSRMTSYKTTKFEDQCFFIPKDYDYYLRTRYGSEYMVPPPNSKRERHIYIHFNLDTTKENGDEI